MFQTPTSGRCRRRRCPCHGRRRGRRRELRRHAQWHTCAGTLNFFWLLAEPSSSTPRLLDVDATAAWGRRAVAFWAASTSS